MKWISLCLLLCGCLSSSVQAVDPIPEPTEDHVFVPQTTDASLTVSASADMWSEIKHWLGPKNTITVGDSFHVERPELTLDLKPNTSISYVTGDDSATFTFAAPLPIITAKKYGLTFHPTLRSVVVKSDGSGVAGTSYGPFAFKWTSDIESGVAADPAEALPEVWAYSTEGCGPCILAKKELAAAQDLPFRVIWKDGPAPSCVPGGYPVFWWHNTEKQPSEKDCKNTHRANGWAGVKDLAGRFRNTRTPKKYERASVGYGHPWVEIENGRTTATSLDHLIREHHLDKMAVEEAIAKARLQYGCGRQEAIDRIHGWCHGEKSTRS